MPSPTCYLPDGTEHSELIAASTDSNEVSVCCKAGDYVFSNNLCLDIRYMTFYRGGCTDQTWDSYSCPHYCMQVPNVVSGVWACGSQNQFACYIPDCDNSSLTFIVNGGFIQQNAALQAAISTTTSTSGSGTAIPTTSSTSSPNTSSSSSSGSSASANDVCPSHIATYAGIGAGLGIPLLISLVALIVVLLQLRKYRQYSAVRTGNITNGDLNAQEQKGPSPLSKNSEAGYVYEVPAKREGIGRHQAELPSTMGGYPTAELEGR